MAINQYPSPLKHEVLIDKHRCIQADKWLSKRFGLNWSPLDNPKGRWTMIWAGHDGSFKDMTNFNKYRVCFADEQDLMMFMLGCP